MTLYWRCVLDSGYLPGGKVWMGPGASLIEGNLKQPSLIGYPSLTSAMCYGDGFSALNVEQIAPISTTDRPGNPIYADRQVVLGTIPHNFFRTLVVQSCLDTITTRADELKLPLDGERLERVKEFILGGREVFKFKSERLGSNTVSDALWALSEGCRHVATDPHFRAKTLIRQALVTCLTIHPGKDIQFTRKLLDSRGEREVVLTAERTAWTVVI